MVLLIQLLFCTLFYSFRRGNPGSHKGCRVVGTRKAKILAASWVPFRGDDTPKDVAHLAGTLLGSHLHAFIHARRCAAHLQLQRYPLFEGGLQWGAIRAYQSLARNDRSLYLAILKAGLPSLLLGVSPPSTHDPKHHQTTTHIQYHSSAFFLSILPLKVLSNLVERPLSFSNSFARGYLLVSPPGLLPRLASYIQLLRTSSTTLLLLPNLTIIRHLSGNCLESYIFYTLSLYQRSEAAFALVTTNPISRHQPCRLNHSFLVKHNVVYSQKKKKP